MADDVIYRDAIIHPYKALMGERWGDDDDKYSIEFKLHTDPEYDNMVGLTIKAGLLNINTYLTRDDAKKIGDSLAILTGCAWYDPLEDIDNTDV